MLYRKSARRYREAMRIHARLWRSSITEMEARLSLSLAVECRENALKCELSAGLAERGLAI